MKIKFCRKKKNSLNDFSIDSIQVMIPLSLYVTIELCKILQVYHIHNNMDLFDIQTNKRTECRAMNITEELGQVCFDFTLLLLIHSIHSKSK